MEVRKKKRLKTTHFRRDFNQWSLLTAALGFAIAIPLFAIILNLFGGTGEMWDHIVSHFLTDYILNSIYLIIGTGTITCLIGTYCAWLVSRYQFPGHRLIEWLLFLPLAIPSYILAYTYVGMLGNGGTLIVLLRSIGLDIQRIEMMNIYGLIWVLSMSLFPYVYASARAMFQSQPQVLRDAAMLLGASERRYFFTVALPLALPAVIGGLFLVLMEVLNDYGAAKYYGINTFTTGIFRSWTALEDLQSAIYLSGMLTVLVFLLMALVKLQRGKKSFSIRIKQPDSATNRKIQVSGSRKVINLGILSVPVLFGFLLPLLQLLYWAVLTFNDIFRPDFFWMAIQSFGIASLSAVLVVIFSLLLIYFNKWNHLRGVAFFPKIATVGYVIPGAIIGIGIISSSQLVIDFFYDLLQIKIGYLFYGSSVILIYAYIFRFLAVAYNPLEANSLKIGKDLAESSYLLGHSNLKTLLKVELPLLKPTALSAMILVFIDTMKELPLTLILKPYQVQTLAVKAYEYAEDERVAEAALPALLLILVVASLLLFVNNLHNKTRAKKNPAELVEH